MDIWSIISVFGGLALFLYGMQVLGDALKAASGSRMEKVLETLTANKWKAALLGAGVTAVIQSSGATVVMIVGLVNSGIMHLSQAVGVILGANVGTTITAWLLSLTGISGDNVALKLMKPENFSPILALVGVGILMFSKKDRQRSAATILVGFSILMIGMSTMSKAFAPLAENPRFTRILTLFQDSPLMGMLAGLAVTAILQSSSASIGILQAISMGGTLTIGSALPILMGENIGSALTALLGAIGSSRNAQRAAWTQMSYCLLKTIPFMIVFYSLNGIFHFGVLNVITNPVMIAVIHSVFNIVALFIFLPVSELLVKLVMRLIPESAEEKEESRRLQILDERFLLTPTFALEQAKNAVVEMAEKAEEALSTAFSLVHEYTDEGAEKVDRLEKTVDWYEDQLNSYLVKLGNRSLNNRDSHSLSILLHCVGDFERITDHSLNIMQAAREKKDESLDFSARAMEELSVYGSAVRKIMEMAVAAFRDDDLDMAREVEPLEEVIDGLTMEEKRRHIRRLRKGKCSVEAGFALSDIVTDGERIADHCSNIAVALLQENEDGFDTHEYLEMEKEKNLPDFEEKVSHYESVYAFPRTKRKKDKNGREIAGTEDEE